MTLKIEITVVRSANNSAFAGWPWYKPWTRVWWNSSVRKKMVGMQHYIRLVLFGLDVLVEVGY